MTAIPIPDQGEQVVIQKAALGIVLEHLRENGYTLIGPQLDDGSITYDEIDGLDDLPVGWIDIQQPGSYRLEQQGNGRYFDYVVGANSWKRFLYPTGLALFATRRSENGFEVIAGSGEVPQYAFIGARACDLAAIQVQDRIFIDSDIQDPHYRERREKAFILAVNCVKPGGTCFCASMGTGPRCKEGYDLVITELQDVFVVGVGSPLGGHMLEGTGWRLAGALEINRAQVRMEQAELSMGRAMDTSDLPDLLLNHLDHPRWGETGDRCMSCTNCTMVCPTCFCSDVVDQSDLLGNETQRIRVWDSCFNPDFSYVHGGNARPTVCSRYRQWLTHKLASWVGQFGVIGCVGCGRCITWCPVGIDLTEEVAAIRGEA
jgi:ferredoxin